MLRLQLRLCLPQPSLQLQLCLPRQHRLQLHLCLLCQPQLCLALVMERHFHPSGMRVRRALVGTAREVRETQQAQRAAWRTSSMRQ